MGFRDKSGIDLENELNPIYPASTAYFDRLYGPRHWSPPATTLNFSIGQGENTQTLINMVQFYEGLAGTGDGAHAVHRAARPRPSAQSLGLTRKELDGLRRALIAVVERGTASRQPPTPTSPWPARPAPPRTRTARTTAGSSASRRPTSRSWSSAGSWSSPSTAPRWRRTSSGRSARYILGPEAVGPVKLGVLLDEIADRPGHRAPAGRARSRLRGRAGRAADSVRRAEGSQ